MTGDTAAYFMREAIRMAVEGVRTGQGGPFGAVVVRDGEIIGRGCNQVLATGDPTAHAEVVAIRDACRQTGHFQLDGCVIYTSCEPCPMCLGAIYWSRAERYHYGCTREDAAQIGFDDDFIYREIDLRPGERSIPGLPLLREEALQGFQAWISKTDRISY